MENGLALNNQQSFICHKTQRNKQTKQISFDFLNLKKMLNRRHKEICMHVCTYVCMYVCNHSIIEIQKTVKC